MIYNYTKYFLLLLKVYYMARFPCTSIMKRIYFYGIGRYKWNLDFLNKKFQIFPIKMKHNWLFYNTIYIIDVYV